jgi:hypothetical protein
MPAPVASGWSDVAGWGSHPLESAALSRRTPLADLQRLFFDDLHRHEASDRGTVRLSAFAVFRLKL